MTLDQINHQIKMYENKLYKLPVQRLGFLLKEYYYSKQKYVVKNSTHYSIVVDMFGFCVSPHDTGVSVECNIILPEEPYQYNIINGTYWYNESQYGFNKFKREYGTWDKAFDIAVDKLRGDLEQHYESCLSKYEDMKQELVTTKANTKSQVESLFS